MKKRGGIVKNTESAFVEGVDYVLVNRKLSKFVVMESLQRKVKGKIEYIKYKEILDFNYVIDCER